jgi:prevent-host-death family protein
MQAIMTSTTNATVGPAEAKNKLSELIERVARGEEITITRHAEAIARLVPAKRPTREEARQAIAAIRALRAKNPASLTVKQILALKNKGRP